MDGQVTGPHETVRLGHVDADARLRDQRLLCTLSHRLNRLETLVADIAVLELSTTDEQIAKAMAKLNKDVDGLKRMVPET